MAEVFTRAGLVFDKRFSSFSHYYPFFFFKFFPAGVFLSQDDMDSIAAAITNPIGIKQLLMVTEMARTDEETVSCERFLECLYTSGYSATPPLEM